MLGGFCASISGTRLSKPHLQEIIFYCLSPATEAHETHASTRRYSAGSAAFGGNAPIQTTSAQDHLLLLLACHECSSKPHLHEPALCWFPGAFAAGTGVSRRRHHASFRPHKRGRPTLHISCAALIERESLRAVSSRQNSHDLARRLRRQLHVVVIRIVLLPRVGSCEQRARRLLSPSPMRDGSACGAERLGEPSRPIGHLNLCCYLVPRRIVASETTSSTWSTRIGV
jgi:hypothetical protein